MVGGTASKGAVRVGKGATRVGLDIAKAVTSPATNVLRHYKTRETPDSTSIGSQASKNADENSEAPVQAERRINNESIVDAMEEGRAEVLDALQRVRDSAMPVALVEDMAGDSKLGWDTVIYSKLELDTDTNPMFKRSWILRHPLNGNSPLLDTEAHQKIRENNGFWPPELNSYEHVRKHLVFNEIMVSLTGTDHVTGNTVYSQKVYDYVDVNIGWKFASMLTWVDISSHGKKNKRVLGLDIGKINDVVEQHGGGAEPFRNVVGTIDVLADSAVSDGEGGQCNVTIGNSEKEE